MRLDQIALTYEEGSNALALIAASPVLFGGTSYAADSKAERELNTKLVAALQKQQFTGRIESTLEKRLGRKLDPALAEVGRMLWFDTITGLHDDNTCGDATFQPTASVILFQ